MENSNAGLALFLDVDLAPEEVAVDFAEQGLAERDELGTVGLWCALHGDSILKAGMHHIAANAQFDRLKEDMSSYHIEFMSPFSDFSYLRQSFSKGEKWDMDPERVKRLLDSNRIDEGQADTFLRQGAIGSHLENIQRREGYKGFNQKNVSAIIKETDPRRQITKELSVE
jgi:4-hydroxyphenylpyruvate dioxygenase-like putative hemolysin